MAEEFLAEDLTEDQTGPGPKGKKVAKKAANINRFVLDDAQVSRIPSEKQSNAAKQADNPYVLSDEELAPIKKKDGGGLSSGGESASQLPLNGNTSQSQPPAQTSQPAQQGNYTDIGQLPGMGTNPLNPVSLLNKEQKRAFIKESGYVRSPEQQKELASNLLERPADPTEQILSFLEDGYANINSLDREKFKDVATKDAVKIIGKLEAENNSKNLRQTVESAMKNGDMSTIKKLINDTYTKQNQRLLEKYDATEDGERVPAVMLKAIGWDGIFDQYDKDVAPLKQQKDKIDQIFKAVASRKYASSNPAIQEEYAGNFLKSEVNPNQFSGLSFLKENEPEKGKQFEMELDKAAHPQSYGLSSYDKNNPEYQYIKYTLDKQGAEINAFASVQNIQDARAKKEVVDREFGARISQVNQQLANTTDPEARKALQDQLNTLNDQYSSNPVNLSLATNQQLLKDSQTLVEQKYPEQTRREREFKVKDILQGDGKSIVGEVIDRLKWLGRETGSGIANLFGLDEAALGASRNYARDLRLGEEKQADLYQPQGTAAQQALYKLNFNDDDYSALSAIKNSDLSKKEKTDAMTDYIKANEQRITYEFNADAGKQNWTSGAIGNQIADVGTQVGYQAALMLLTEGAAKMAATARPVASAAAGEAAAVADVYDNVATGVNKAYSDLGGRLRKFGSVFGSTYATTYQSAYVNGLQEGLSAEESEDYANQIAIVNGLTETISPDVDVIKRAASGVKAIGKGLSSDMLTKAGKFKSVAGAFAKGYIKNVVPETMEEYAAAIGEYGVDAIHNINQDDLNSLSNRIQNAVTSTMIGMVPLGVFSGVNTARRVPHLQKESLYRAGMYPEMMTTEITGLVADGTISQDEANKRIKLVNTSSQIVRDMPSVSEGVNMTEPQRQSYVYNEMQKNALQDKLAAASDPNTKKILNQQINGLETTNAQLVESATLPQAADQAAEVSQKPSDGNADLLEQARAAALNDMAPTMAGVFAEDIEEGLKEAAQQLNASESEAKTAREFYGDRVSDIALQLFPKETVEAAQERKEIIQSGRELVANVNPVLERMNNADYINENELNAAADQIYSLLDRTEKSTYTPEQQASIANLFEPIISKIEGYEFRTKTETSTVTEKVPVQVAKQTTGTRQDIRPPLEDLQGSTAVLTKNGKQITGILKLENGTYNLYNTEGEKTGTLGEKVLNDQGLTVPSEEEMDNYIGMDENGNVKSITLKTKDGDLITFNNPEKALDLAIKFSSNIIDEVSPEEFDTIYEEIQREIQKEVLVNDEGTTPAATEPVSSNETAATEQGNKEAVSAITPSDSGAGTTGGATIPVTQSEAPRSDERKFTKQVLKAPEIEKEVKKEVKKTLKYARQTNGITLSQAQEILANSKPEEVVDMVKNDPDLNPAVRVVLGQALIKKFNELAGQAKTLEEKNDYLDKTADIATFVTEKLATEPGRMIQTFSLFSQLTPEAQLRAATKEKKQLSQKSKDQQAKRSQPIADQLQKVNEETADAITQSKKIAEKISATDSERTKKAKAKIEAAKKKREALKDQHKKDKGKNLYASVGLTNEGIEYAGNLAATYIQEGYYQAQLIIDKVLADLKEVTGREPNDEVKSNVSSIVAQQVAAVQNKKIAASLQELEKQVNEIVREHYKVSDAEKTSLVNKFMDQTGLEKDEATALAGDIQKEFDRIATRKKQEILYKEKARYESVKNKLKGAKTAPTIDEDIIRYSNLGAFSNNDLIDMLADKLGTGTLTAEQGKRIQELAEKIEKAPEGSPKREATEDLLKYRAQINGTSWGEIAQAIWYANVLSGYTTQIKNVVANMYNSFAILATEAVRAPRSIPFLLAGAGVGYKRGAYEAFRTLITGRSPIHNSKVETPAALERINFTGGLLNPANWFKFVSRVMVASDVLSFQGLKEFRATQLAYREAKKNGYSSPFSKAAWNEVNEQLLNTPQRREDAAKQAESEGFKGTEMKRRIYELMELSRPIQMTEDAYGFAAKGTFNHPPEGTLGALTTSIARLLDVQVGGVKPVRFLIPFTNIITNVANNALDYTPVGLVRAARGVRGFESFENTPHTKNAYKELTREERIQDIAKASLGIGLTLGMYALTQIKGDGDEPILEITGGGTGDFKKDAQLRDQGWQPYSIKYNGKYFSYALTPMVLNLGFIGNVNDYQKYNKNADDKSTLEKSTLALYQSGKMVTDMTWIGSTATLMSALASDNPARAESEITNTLSNSAKGFLIPNIYTQAAQKMEQIYHMPPKETNGFLDQLQKDIPVARNSMFDKINGLGDPVSSDKDILVSDEKKDPVWQYLFSKKNWVAPVAKKSLMVYDEETHKDRQATPEEYYNFSKVRGQEIKRQIQNIIANGVVVNEDKVESNIPAAELSPAQLTKLLTKVKTEATKLAKATLFNSGPAVKKYKIDVIE